MPTAHFTVAVDVAPAAPTHLQAVPGDGSVSLTWDPSPEPDVVSYGVYRGAASGGPYSLVATVGEAAFLDQGLPNGVTVYYVVTAMDGQFESDPSAEVAATPMASPLAGFTRFRPSRVRQACLTHPCLSNSPWMLAFVHLPEGYDPASIDPASLRLNGTLPADPSFHEIVDDQGPALLVQFPLASVYPMLTLGMNTLNVTGTAGPHSLLAPGTVEVVASSADSEEESP
jgi:hypothetical protein